MKPYLKLMRVHHYVKNALIFAPLVFSGDFFRMEKLLSAVLAFVSFCFLSSAVYVVNDIRDVEKDRLHPTKCRRPIASGAVKVPAAWGLMAALLVLSGVCHVLSGVVFFAEYAEGSGLSPLMYSLSYNSFVFVDLAICLLVVAFPQVRKALARMNSKH